MTSGQEYEGRTRLLVGALVAAGLMLALFIAFVVPNLIDDEGEEPDTQATGETPTASPDATGSPSASPSPGASPTPTTPGSTPSPDPGASPSPGTGAGASPTPTPQRTTPSSGGGAAPPAPPPAPPAPPPAPPAPVDSGRGRVEPVAYGENGKTYAAVYVMKDGKWVPLAEAIGNDARPITP